jgi:hypothetical protein
MSLVGRDEELQRLDDLLAALPERGGATGPEESARLYARYVIPAPGTWSFDAPAGGALEVAGGEDNLVRPPARGARVIPGRCHFTLVQGGWERVADDVLAWALRQ